MNTFSLMTSCQATAVEREINEYFRSHDELPGDSCGERDQ